MKFSLLMSVYKNDVATDFKASLQSIYDNILWPDEIILVCDGPLNQALNQVIANYIKVLPLKVYKLSNNIGLAKALSYGLQYCQYKWVARFDADDICTIDRFKKQVDYLASNPSVDVLGGQVIEFNDSLFEKKLLHKVVPLENNQIYAYAQSRNPINHMTVMFKKSAVLNAGSYQHAPLYEDYDLWVRMLLKGCKFANLADVLVYAKAGNNMYERRGGLSYAKQEIKMQVRFYNLGFLSLSQMITNLIVRLPIRLLPNKVRGQIYSKILRKTNL